MPPRLVPNEPLRRGLARRRLMDLLWEKRGVRNAVEIDLRPLWKSFAKAHPELSVEIYSFDDLYLAPVSGQLGFPNPPTSPYEPFVRPPQIDPTQLRIYLEALEVFVSKQLRITAKGRVPTWAMSDVHDRVLGQVPDSTFTELESGVVDFWETPTRPPHTTITLRLDITASRALVTCIDENANDLLHFDVLLPEQRDGKSFPDVYRSFANWKALEKSAIRAVTKYAIPRIKDAQTRDIRQRNEGTEDEMIPSIALVADWCYDKQTPDPQERDRLGKGVLDVLDIDPPPVLRKNALQNRIRSFREHAKKRGMVNPGREA